MREDDRRIDEEARYSMSWDVALRLQYAMQDGYITPAEMEHVLVEMGILTDWKNHFRREA